MTRNSKNVKGHNHKVVNYFDRAAVTFDTFYDHKRTKFMQWVDKKFRSDVFDRYYRTFETLEPLTDKTVLDIGCGSGPYIIEVARRGSSKVVGLDMAQGMLDLAKQRAEAAGCIERCQFVLGMFPQDVPQEKFNYAIVMGVMDYIEDAVTFIQGVREVVSFGAVLSFPSTHWFRTPLRKVRYYLRNCPVYFYTNVKISQLMQKVGIEKYQIVKIPGAGMDYVVWAEM